MAFWEEPPNYMIERERRLLGPRDQLIQPPDPDPTPQAAVEPEAAVDSEGSYEEKSNLRQLAKEKLEELGKYVLHHIFRRLRAKWPKLRELILDKVDLSGIGGASRKSLRRISTGMTSLKSTLPLSSLIEIFVCPEIQIDMKDSRKIFEEMGVEEVNLSVACKLFAANLENQIFDDVEFNFLRQTREERVSESRLLDALFSTDPVKRSWEMKQAEADYAEWVQYENEKLRKLRALEEKANSRTLKNRNMFEKAFAELQPIRGPLHAARLNKLFDMYMGCLQMSHQIRIDEATQIIRRHQNIVSLLGREWFSDRYLRFIDSPPFTLFQVPNLDNLNSFKFHWIFLSGKPTFLQLCRQLIQQGKGLHGLSHYEAAELVQAFAATKIQTHFRMYHHHWRYAKACKKWSLRFRNIKRQFISAWYTYTRMILTLRKSCLRKIIAWRYFTKENIRRRALYQHCFWPMYVWRKYSIRSRTIKEKTKFLCSRVYPTYIKLRNFRAWKKLTREVKGVKDLVDGKYQTHLNKLKVEFFQWLRRWTSERRELRRSWVKAKIYDTRNKILMYKLSYFQVWKGYSMYRSLVQSRVKAYLPAFRRALLKGVPPRDYYEIYRNEHLAIARIKQRNREVVEKKYARKLKKRQRMIEERGSANYNFAVQEDDVSESESDLDSEEDLASSDPLGADEYPSFFPQQRMERHMLQSTWRAYRSPEMYDVDIDGETSEVPNTLRSIYNECVPHLGESIDEETLRWGSPFVRLKYSHLVHNFSKVEAWAFLEEAMLFHRVASKAFRNLQIFAVVRIRARRAYAKYRLGLMRKVFQALYEWMQRTEVTDNSEAEALALAARAARLNRLQQRRQIQKRALSDIEDASQINP